MKKLTRIELFAALEYIYSLSTIVSQVEDYIDEITSDYGYNDDENDSNAELILNTLYRLSNYFREKDPVDYIEATNIIGDILKLPELPDKFEFVNGYGEITHASAAGHILQGTGKHKGENVDNSR